MELKGNFYIKAKKFCLCTETLLNKQLCGDELTASQGYLLYHIWQYHPNGISLTSLHNELGMSKATISSSLKKLRHKGFLLVEQSPVDERQKKLVPTVKLERIAENLKNAFDAVEDKVYGELTEAEKALLIHLEEKALKNVLCSSPD